DETYFAVLVRGAVEHQARIDKAVRARLAEGWRLERIDATLRAILRVGAFELIGGDLPSEVVIDEYVEIAKSFFDGPEAGFVNGALDGIARDERPA
ncbi:MAG TPA: transcription antitermination factor NusB, partial [Caulobacteraceae bacterium]|nr:transcription antitermination factor NusB [Caulobacteraceae bacterium]